MNILGVESSAGAAGAAVLTDEVLVSEVFSNNGLTHSETLMPMIARALEMANLKVSDIDLFAVSCGPGSYTGIRIGVGIVKGLAFGADKPVVGVSSLLALALNIPSFEGIVAPVMDARSERLYAAAYRRKGESLEEIIPPSATTVEDFAQRLRGEKVIFVGDGALSYETRLKNLLGDGAYFAPPNLCMARAASVAALAARGKGISPFDLSPVYLRPPQAERVREEI